MGKDYADGITFGEPLFSSHGLWESCCNYSLLGATADQLGGWGYDVTSVLRGRQGRVRRSGAG